MKTLYTLSILVLLCCGCESPSSVKARKANIYYVLTVDQIGVKPAEDMKPAADEVCITVPVSLENKSASELKYWMMSCEREAIYTTDNGKVKIMRPLRKCEKNVPMQISVTPQVALGMTLIVCVKKTDGQQKFKIGMALRAKKEDFAIGGMDKLFSNPDNLTWSNEVTTP